MGLLQGSMNVSRYKVLGLAAHAKLDDHAFKSLRAKKTKLQGASYERSVGWDRGADHDDTEWDLIDCAVADGYVLTIKIDQRKVPARLLQQTAKQRTLKALEKKAKGLSKAERREIYQNTRDELLGLCLPDIRYVECYWNTKTQHIVLATQSKKWCGAFEELFYKSFCEPMKVQLMRCEPPVLSGSVKADQLSSWVQLAPSAL